MSFQPSSAWKSAITAFFNSTVPLMDPLATRSACALTASSGPRTVSTIMLYPGQMLAVGKATVWR